MKYKDLLIQTDTSIIEALKIMDVVEHKMLLVYEGVDFYSIITIGDLQRAIISNIGMSTDVKNIINREQKEYASPKDSVEEIKRKMLTMRCEFMPVIDEKGDLVHLYNWADFFSPEKNISTRDPIDLPIVIMAGGIGSRLKPLTNVIPKPLIPIGKKTILEEIMDQFESIGCKNFYMSVNYKYEFIEFYLSQLEHHYHISFFKEEKPLGTIGSVSLLKDKITTPFFVSNCDNLIDQDYRDVYEYHQKNKNDITIITSVKSFRIPYGVIETTKNGVMTDLKEKPEFNYMINTGVYILQPELIKEIPENEFFHITDLMNKVRVNSGRIGCFPVSEKAWTDMGDWNEYLKLIKK